MEGTCLMKRITISVEDVVLTAELNESKTAQKIYDSLPLESTINVWGEEIYFDIPVALEPEPDARQDVEVGTLGYWPLGSAFCVFFGPTPASSDDQPRSYSPVNVFGHVIGDAKILKKVSGGSTVRVEKAQD
jgi:hypothetical protein